MLYKQLEVIVVYALESRIKQLTWRGCALLMVSIEINEKITI